MMHQEMVVSTGGQQTWSFPHELTERWREIGSELKEQLEEEKQKILGVLEDNTMTKR